MNNTFFTVYDFMIKDLHLSKNELLVYALIFSFSVHAEGGCTASQGYMAKRIGVSRETVNKCLCRLCKKGLIEEKNSGKKTKQYLLKNLTGDAQKLYDNLLKSFAPANEESSFIFRRNNKTFKNAYGKREHQQSAPSFDFEKAKKFLY